MSDYVCCPAGSACKSCADRLRAERDAAFRERDEARAKGRFAAIRGIAMASEAQDQEIDRLAARLEEARGLLEGMVQLVAHTSADDESPTVDARAWLAAGTKAGPADGEGTR